MPRVGVARALEQVETGADPCEQRVGGEELGAGGRELERERHPVQALAQFVDGGAVHELGTDRLCPREEERSGLIGDERRQVELDLGADAKRRAARHQQTKLRRLLGDGGNHGGGLWEKLLDVVEHHVRPLGADAGCDRSWLGRLGAQRLAERRKHERRVAQRREGDEDRPTFGVLRQHACELDREACLAGASGADDGEHPRVALEQDGDGVEELLLAPEELRGRRGELDRARCAQRGKAVAAELMQSHGPTEVLQPMAPKVTEPRCVEQARGRIREERLATVCERADPSGAVHVDADVAFVGDGRRAGVQADADTDRSFEERVLAGERGGRGSRRGREGDEEGVALRVHLDATMRRESHAQYPPVLCERLRVGVGSKRVQQPRRALHVGEEKRDGAGRQVRPHACKRTTRLRQPSRPMR